MGDRGIAHRHGKPILANDPHLEFSIPSPWYLVHLQAPGLNVTGATIIGLPAVIIGHNDRIAWGITNLQFDVQDLYREQIDFRPAAICSRPSEQRGWSATHRRERRAAHSDRHLDHAPRPAVLSQTPGSNTALRWTAAEPGGLTFPFLDHRSRA